VKQLKVNLPDALRGQLEVASEAAGHSVAEEIRQRLEQTFKEGSDQHTRALMLAIDNLDFLVRIQTGKAWHQHAGAARVFRTAIIKRLVRLLPKSGTAEFRPDELPQGKRLVESDDPETMGVGLEAIEFSGPPHVDLHRELLNDVFEKLLREKRDEFRRKLSTEEDKS
jgi:hypothetical protein